MTDILHITLAQLNPTVGALVSNRHLIVDACLFAEQQGSSVLITPELALTGYPPEDLLLRPAFIEQVQFELEKLCQATQHLNLTLIVGHPLCEMNNLDITHEPIHKSLTLYNAASVIHAGKIIGQYRKQLLPNHQVFDEKRYFTEGSETYVTDIAGKQCGILICEDAWHDAPVRACVEQGAEILLILNASPYHIDKNQLRLQTISQHAKHYQIPIIYVNQVGGQDELVFDGQSFICNNQGDNVYQSAFAQASIDDISFDFRTQTTQALKQHTEPNRFFESVVEKQKNVNTPERQTLAEIYRILVLGVRDYIHKNHFKGVIIGLSGGVDSALVLAIAVDALGPQHVRAVMLQSPYTADISWIDAQALAQNLKVQYDEMPIADCMHAFEQVLTPHLQNVSNDTTLENIQARIRGTMLMGLSNNSGRIVLTTGNKSEMATGYCTLYGDMAGGFAVIKDVLKTRVYALCNWRNQTIAKDIPERILTRAPSAELRPDQTDQDSLPDYAILDEIITRYMEQKQSITTMLNAGLPPKAIEQTVRLIKINEYKRRQAPIGIRITERGFGRDWRYPITNQFKE